MINKTLRYNVYDYLSFCKQNLNKKVIYFDIGSNIGSTIIFALRLKFKVYAFEPSKYFSNLKKIYYLCKLNFNSNLNIFNIAFSNINSKKKIYYNPNNLGNISFEKKFINLRNKNRLKFQYVKCLTLDKFNKINNIDKIDIVKIDVEGHVFQILQKSFSLFRLKSILILELDPNDKNLNQILKLLKKNNYKLGFYKKISGHDDYFFYHKDHKFINRDISRIRLLNTKKNLKFKKFQRIFKRFARKEFYALSWLNLKYDITLD